MYQFKLNDPHFLPHYGCDVEICLEPGKVVAISGKNGIGKTTLLQRFYRQESFKMSLVEQAGLDFFYDRKLSQIKVIFLSARGNEVSKELFFKSWESFGLSQKEDRYQSKLSGGEGQMLKLCFGLAAKRDVYLLDEPSQYLDARSKTVLGEILNELIKHGSSILMIEHDLDWQKFDVNHVELEVVSGTLVKGKSWNT
jgi:ABC-type Mn2+/Zn2+ transport system ATPase subunit